jgi:hypothetical protein
MRGLKYVLLAASALLFLVPAPAVQAQISVGIGIGGPGYGAYGEPICPYGYYDYAPYSCSPYGYYGPEWFNGGVFIGAGRWYHGSAGFRGHVDNGYDPRHGYRGPFPQRGDKAFNHFHGNNMRAGGAGFHGGGGHAGGGGNHGGGGGGHR